MARKPVTRWNPITGDCPPLLLSPDGRYSCDNCEALVVCSQLTENRHGFLCPDCAGREDARGYCGPQP